jgi:hypothetical protein
LEDLTGAFKTIKDVTISTVRGSEAVMEMEGLYLANISACTFTITDVATALGVVYPGDTVMKIGGNSGAGTGQDASVLMLETLLVRVVRLTRMLCTAAI